MSTEIQLPFETLNRGDGLLWFFDPLAGTPPAHSREHVFLATVYHMDRIGHCDHLRMVHDYLTFLLRGWNPITAWVNYSAYDSRDNLRDPLFDDLVQSLFGRLLDFEKEHGSGFRYDFLSNLARMCVASLHPEHDEFIGEKLTLTVLSAWAILKKVPDVSVLDYVSMRACLDLYYRSELRNAIDDVNSEYLQGRGLNYGGWLLEQLDRLARSDLPTDKVVEIVIYLAWFSSLVRAGRMSKPVATQIKQESLNHLSNDLLYAEAIPIIMSRHVKELRNALNKKPLSLYEPQQATSTLRSFFNVFGVKPKKRLPSPTA